MADRWMEPLDCPGGEFLPEDALVIEKDTDGEWPKKTVDVLWFVHHDTPWVILDALAADQVGEPE